MLLSVPQVVHSDVDWSAPVNWFWPAHRNLQSWFLSHPGGGTGWGTTRWRDLLGKNHATLSNFASPPSSTSGWATARGRRSGAGALRFDGTNDVGVCSAYPQTTTTYGATMWVNLPGGPVQTIYLSHDANTNNGWRIADKLASNLRFILGGVAIYEFTSLVPVTGWNFVALSCTGNGGAATMWLKTPSGGLASQTLSIGTMTGTPTQLTLGNTPSQAFFLGWMDDVRVFKSTLTDAQVRAIHDDAIRGYPDSLARQPVEQWFADTPPAGGGGGGGYWSWWAWHQFGRPLSPEA